MRSSPQTGIRLETQGGAMRKGVVLGLLLVAVTVAAPGGVAARGGGGSGGTEQCNVTRCIAAGAVAALPPAAAGVAEVALKLP
jgi:hypothetical protein